MAETSSEPTEIGFETTLDLTTYRHAVRVTNATHEDLDSVLARMACHRVVDLMPETGMPELLESLAGMYEFYLRRAGAYPSLPAPSAPIRARVTGVTQRPDFYVVED